MTNQKPKDTTDTDIQVGINIKLYRTLNKMSRVKFAKKIGVSHQQMKKYEFGQTRLTVARALQMTRILGITLNQLVFGPKGSKNNAQKK